MYGLKNFRYNGKNFADVNYISQISRANLIIREKNTSIGWLRISILKSENPGCIRYNVMMIRNYLDLETSFSRVYHSSNCYKHGRFSVSIPNNSGISQILVYRYNCKSHTGIFRYSNIGSYSDIFSVLNIPTTGKV